MMEGVGFHASDPQRSVWCVSIWHNNFVNRNMEIRKYGGTRLCVKKAEFSKYRKVEIEAFYREKGILKGSKPKKEISDFYKKKAES